MVGWIVLEGLTERKSRIAKSVMKITMRRPRRLGRWNETESAMPSSRGKKREMCEFVDDGMDERVRKTESLKSDRARVGVEDKRRERDGSRKT